MSFFTGHCLPFSDNTNTTTLISDFVTTGGIANITNEASGLSANHYENFYDTNAVSSYADGQFDFSVSIEGGTVGCAIWIDWNSDLLFDVETEVVYNTTAYGNGPFTGTVTVPSGTVNGDYKMRVMIDWNDSNPSAATGDDACSLNSGRGEIEDYKVTVTDAPACLTPTALLVDNILFNAVDFSWTENGTAASWDIELVDITAAGVATGTPTTVATSDNPFEITGLVAVNDYEVYVRANCGASTSAWAGPIAFTTAVACPVPSDLTASNFTETSAELSWTENGESMSYNIEIGETGFTPTGTPTVTEVSNPYVASGLTIATVYDYYVQADCDAEGFSVWAGPFTFSTLCGFADVPYMEDFETGGACGSIINEGTGNAWQFVTTASYGFAANHLRYTYNSTSAADTWFFTQGINLTAGQDYTVSYDYGGTGTTFTEKLKVAYGTSATAAGMTTELADYPTVDSSVPVNDMQTFTAPADGVYYIGFQAYSDADKFYLHLDNIAVDVALSVGNFENENAFTYFPNPVKNTLTLNAQNTIEQVAMYNMLGQEVLRATPNTVDSELDMSQLQTGAYFVKVTIANITQTIRVIKQ